MNYIKNMHPVQQLATGETLFIHEYIFGGTKQGPNIYVQANLHGSEVFGAALAGKLISYLTSLEKIIGSVVIVPCANPVAVQDTVYNGMAGRWNKHSGTNWNRIFVSYKDSQSPSIEQTIASTLQNISSGSTHVIDIHTTGVDNANHLFTGAHSHEIFAPLGCLAHIEWTDDDAVGAFDESQPKETHACTWEVHHHNTIDPIVLEERWQQLKACIDAIWENKKQEEIPPVFPLSHCYHMPAPTAGYVMWTAPVGTLVKKGEPYATVYKPWSDTWQTLQAKEEFFLFGVYGIGAVASGEPIGWIGTRS